MKLVGSFYVDDDFNVTGTNLFRSGTFSYTSHTAAVQGDLIEGCYRPPTYAWYLRPFPFWTQFVIVPLFSIFSSLSNLQPLRSVQLIVMVVISCAAYTVNRLADHLIKGRGDIVSAIGAFSVGVLGNLYSRKMSGTAFTSMVTGVLFLVPVSAINALGVHWF